MSATDLLLPAEPLVDLIYRECGSIPSADADPRLRGVTTSRTLHRTRRRGTVRLSTADRIVTALGHHPLEVFGPEFYADLGT